MPNAIELRQQRANIWEQAKALLDMAESEGRDLTAEEQEQWDRMNTDMDTLLGRIERLERAARIDDDMSTLNRRVGLDAGQQGQQRADGPVTAQEEYRAAFDAYLRYGRENLDVDQRKLLGLGRVQFEGRALTSLTGASGGFTVPDADMQALVGAMIDWGGISRARTRKLSTSDGRDIPVPTGNDTGNIGRRIGENTQVASDQDPSFGAKVLRAYMYTTDVVLVPYALLEDAAFDVGSWILEQFGQRLGRIEDSEDTLGTGDSMPEGLIPALTVGKTTAADDEIDWTELVDLEHSIYSAYRRNAQWMMNDSTVKHFKQMKTGVGTPLWQPGLTSNAPDTILGYPYVVSFDMAAIAATAKVIAFGDFMYYWQRNVRGFQMLRLEERYADYAQVGFLGFHRHDGKYVNPGTDPIKVLQMHA